MGGTVHTNTGLVRGTDRAARRAAISRQGDQLGTRGSCLLHPAGARGEPRARVSFACANGKLYVRLTGDRETAAAIWNDPVVRVVRRKRFAAAVDELSGIARFLPPAEEQVAATALAGGRALARVLGAFKSSRADHLYLEIRPI